MVHVQKVEHQSKREQDAPAPACMQAGSKNEPTSYTGRSNTNSKSNTEQCEDSLRSPEEDKKQDSVMKPTKQYSRPRNVASLTIESRK